MAAIADNVMPSYSVPKKMSIKKFLRQNLMKDEHSHDSEHALYKGLMVFITILVLYISVGSWMEKKKFVICHETGFIIVFGIILSILLEIYDHETAEAIGFSNELFFEVLLPFIIFATGYNMRRKNFFENIINISKFGILGTVLTFVFYSILFILLFDVFGLEYYNPSDFKDEYNREVKKGWHPFELSTI